MPSEAIKDAAILQLVSIVERLVAQMPTERFQQQRVKADSLEALQSIRQIFGAGRSLPAVHIEGDPRRFMVEYIPGWNDKTEPGEEGREGPPPRLRVPDQEPGTAAPEEPS